MFMLWLEWFGNEKKMEVVWERKGRWFLDESPWEGERGHNLKHNWKDFSLVGVGYKDERLWFVYISSLVRWNSGLINGEYAAAVSF